VLFADDVTKYDRRYNAQKRTLLLTARDLYLVALEKVKDGPNKGKIMHVLKRKFPLSSIGSISLSTLADDIFILRVPSEYDNVFESVFKTELISLIREKVQEISGRDVVIDFNDNLEYTIKKEGFGGGGKKVIKFVKDPSVHSPTMVKGVMKVPPGLPKDSRNMQITINSAPRGKQQQQQQRGPPQGYQQQQQPQFQQQQYQQPPPQQQFQQQPPFQQPRGGMGMPGAGGPPRGGMGMPGAGGPPRGGFGAPPPTGNMGGSNPAMNAGPPRGGMGMPGAGGPPRGGAAGKPMPPPANKPKLPQCRALFAYNATEADELSFQPGDVITITNKENEGWWEGTSKGRKGLFPSNYVEMLA